MDLNHVFIGLGGNLGDVRKSFETARQELDRYAGIRVLRSSLLYVTPPVGPQDQNDFLNAVVSIRTSLTPLALLELLQGLETRAGRTREVRWGPRTLDLDILSYNDVCLETRTLSLPHPRMHERQFVLRPLCDIAPDWQHPILKKTASVLLGELLDAGEAPLPEGSPW